MKQSDLFDREAAARDRALDLLEWTREKLIARAGELADKICAREGRVTSVEVMAALDKQAEGDELLGAQLRAADPRWMGAVFRAGRGWRRAGWEPTGSHKRPVAIWVRR